MSLILGNLPSFEFRERAYSLHDISMLFQVTCFLVQLHAFQEKFTHDSEFIAYPLGRRLCGFDQNHFLLGDESWNFRWSPKYLLF
jgi:hypothetical protein